MFRASAILCLIFVLPSAVWAEDAKKSLSETEDLFVAVCNDRTEKILAEEHCKKLLAPEFSEDARASAWFSLGLLYQDSNKDEAAISAYDEVEKLKPDWTGLYFNRALIRRFRGEIDAALQDLRNAVNRRPTYAKAWLDISLIEGNRNNHFAAIEAAQMAIKGTRPELRRKDMSKAYNNWGDNLMDVEKYDEALDKLKRAVELDQKNAVARRNIVRSYAYSDRWKEARGQLNEVEKIDPGSIYNKRLAELIRNKSGL